MIIKTDYKQAASFITKEYLKERLIDMLIMTVMALIVGINFPLRLYPQSIIATIFCYEMAKGTLGYGISLYIYKRNVVSHFAMIKMMGALTIFFIMFMVGAIVVLFHNWLFYHAPIFLLCFLILRHYIWKKAITEVERAYPIDNKQDEQGST